jgi:hypothetical protein
MVRRKGSDGLTDRQSTRTVTVSMPACSMPRIGVDGNASPRSPRHERTGMVGAGAAPSVDILPEPLPEPLADGPRAR